MSLILTLTMHSTVASSCGVPVPSVVYLRPLTEVCPRARALCDVETAATVILGAKKSRDKLQLGKAGRWESE